jgi:hypothetical protein
VILLYQDCEALQWLSNNQNSQTFACSRFSDTESAVDFVRQLYRLGAQEVRVAGILDERWRSAEDGGPYNDCIVVYLPKDEQQRNSIFEFYLQEIDNNNCHDGEHPIGQSHERISFWWD